MRTKMNAINSDQHLTKLFEKLAGQVINQEYELHFMREAVRQEQEGHRCEEANLRDLERQQSEAARTEKRGEAQRALAHSECEKHIEDFLRETNEKGAVALQVEVNKRMMAELTDWIAEREEAAAAAAAALGQPKQPQAGAVVALNVAANQIMLDAQEMITKISAVLNGMKKLEEKDRSAQRIVQMLLAYKESQRMWNLQLTRRLRSLDTQNESLRQHLATNNVMNLPAIQSTHSSVGSSREGSDRSSTLRKELEMEKLRGAELVRELCEVSVQASAKAARREKWLNREFPHQE